MDEALRNERGVRLVLSELLDSNSPDRITKDTDAELKEKMICDFANLLELCELLDGVAYDLSGLRMEWDPDYEK